MKWKEIKSDKIKIYQFEDEPEIIYIIKIRFDEYMVIQEDGWDLNTGKIEFLNQTDLFKKYGI